MSGLEVVAVVGAVAGVISAYKDASRIVADFKDKRRAKKAEQLERSLARGPLAVEEARNNGVERFGQAFAEGDQIAREALKDVLIALQGSLLRQLAPAAHNEDVVDFSMLVDISDIGRIKSVEALWELHMRMATAAPIGQHPFSTLPYPSGQPSRLLTESEQGSTATALRGVGIFHGHPAYGSPSSPHHLLGEQQSSSINRQDTIETLSTTASAKSSNRLRWPFQRRSSRSSNARDNQASQTPPNENSPKRTFSPKLASSPELVREACESESNPWEHMPSASNVKSADTASTRTSVTSLSTSVLPSPANDYGGFCKGAYYLQAGLHKDGVRLRNMSTAKTGESWYWGCRNTKCVFESPACKIRKEFFFDNSVRHFQGVRYRWAFLAKSHVALKRSKDQIYDYRCIFCVLQGKEAPVITRIRPFLEHVTQHRWQPIDESILLKTLCINDRLAADDEYFDINLPPLETVSPGNESLEPDCPSRHDEEQAEPANSYGEETHAGGLGISSAWSVSGDDILNEDPWRDP